MPDQDFQPLVTIGPFKGVDYTTSQFELETGDGVDITGANTSIRKGLLLPERGRVLMFDFSTVGMIIVSQIVPVVIPLDAGLTGNQPAYVVQGYKKNGALLTVMYVPSSATAGTVTTLTNDVVFDQAVQFYDVLYTNGGQRFFLGLWPNYLSFYVWQYTYPASMTSTVVLTPSVTGGFMIGAIYYYALTRLYSVPDTTFDETSANPDDFAMPPFTTIIGGTATTTGSITLDFSGMPANFLYGTSPDGRTYTSRLYRQSTNLPDYHYVANLNGGSAPGRIYVDTTPDVTSGVNTGIAGNPVLQPNRDPPPTVAGVGDGIPAGNQAALAIHKNRLWVFITVEDEDVPGPQAQQNQLWYSNVARGWEFNAADQVLLCDTDVSNTNQVSTSYDDQYGNSAKALASTGSILVAFKQRDTWAVWGDTSQDYVARELFSIGCVSRHSVIAPEGGVFWLSNQGVYWFDGSAPQYTSEKIRGYLVGVPDYLSGIALSDQIQAAGAWKNLTYYLTFPTLGITLQYFTVTGTWLGRLLYAAGGSGIPMASAAIASSPSNPQKYFAGIPGEVVASRDSLPYVVDYWLASQNSDIDAPQTFAFYGPITDSKAPSYEKQYRFATCYVQPGTVGQAVITLKVDNQDPWTWHIPDLSTGVRFIQSVGRPGDAGGLLRGFVAKLTVSVTGVSGQPAPGILNVQVWGSIPPDRNLRPPV